MQRLNLEPLGASLLYNNILGYCTLYSHSQWKQKVKYTHTQHHTHSLPPSTKNKLPSKSIFIGKIVSLKHDIYNITYLSNISNESQSILSFLFRLFQLLVFLACFLLPSPYKKIKPHKFFFASKHIRYFL